MEHAGTDSSTQRDAASDESLAARVKRGDAEALEQLIRRYVRRVHAVVASYLSEPADADDAAQETFLRALRAIDAYDSRRPFAPWLYQIARNVARNEIEARARWRNEEPSGTLVSRLPGPDSIAERSEVRARVFAAILQLPEQQRTVFCLSDVEGYSAEEIGRMMGLAPGTVRSHLHHARRALRTALGDRHEVEETGG